MNLAPLTTDGPQRTATTEQVSTPEVGNNCEQQSPAATGRSRWERSGEGQQRFMPRPRNNNFQQQWQQPLSQQQQETPSYRPWYPQPRGGTTYYNNSGAGAGNGGFGATRGGPPRRWEQTTPRQQYNDARADPNGPACGYCGRRPSHPQEQCPAQGKRCNFCNGVGHFRVACRRARGARAGINGMSDGPAGGYDNYQY
jgi:hypothetical protein